MKSSIVPDTELKSWLSSITIPRLYGIISLTNRNCDEQVITNIVQYLTSIINTTTDINKLPGYTLLLLYLLLHPKTNQHQKPVILNILFQHRLLLEQVTYWEDFSLKLKLFFCSDKPNPTELSHLKLVVVKFQDKKLNNHIEPDNIVSLPLFFLSSDQIKPFFKLIIFNLYSEKLLEQVANNPCFTKEDYITIYNQRHTCKNSYYVSWFLIYKAPNINLKTDLFYQYPNINNALLLLSDPNLKESSVFVDIFRMYANDQTIKRVLLNHSNCPASLKLKQEVI